MSIAPPSSYQDVGFLTVFPLTNPAAVLDYFATSPFFDQESNNQLLRSQQMLQLHEHLSQMTGLEYQVDERLSAPPRMFAVVKQYRRSAQRTDFLEAYYCLDGVIYQCPTLMDVIRVRFSKIASSLGKSFDTLLAHSSGAAEGQPASEAEGTAMSVES